jgi:hypothetical protein
MERGGCVLGYGSSGRSAEWWRDNSTLKNRWKDRIMKIERKNGEPGNRGEKMIKSGFRLSELCVTSSRREYWPVFCSWDHSHLFSVGYAIHHPALRQANDPKANNLEERGTTCQHRHALAQINNILLKGTEFMPQGSAMLAPGLLFNI